LALVAVGLALCLAGPAAPAAEGPPVLLAVALDASGSLSDADIGRAHDLAVRLLERLPAGSQIAVFSFDDESRLLQPRTSDAGLVRRALSRVKRTGRYTALHDALYDASRYLKDVPADRRGIVLFTDGHDENSSLTLEDGLRVAQDGRIPVYAVGLGRVQERVLRRIAKLTGGDYLTGARATGDALAARVQAAAAEPAAAGAPPPAHAAAPAPAPRVPASPASGPPVPGAASSSRLFPALWLALLVAGAAAGAFVVARRRRAPGPEAGASGEATLRMDLSPTVVERLNTTEEYLEKTIVLRERPVLTITRGPGTGELFELSRATAVSIGRARANDIVLKDISISSQHCRIRPEDGGFVLHDLKSTNGTFVNDKRVSRHPLADGDLVQVGETVMQFRTEHRRA
jgi:hypothetical protein